MPSDFRWHSFLVSAGYLPDTRETWRVLKNGGTFIACFYIKEKSKITDWLVKNILSKKGWFTSNVKNISEIFS